MGFPHHIEASVRAARPWRHPQELTADPFATAAPAFAPVGPRRSRLLSALLTVVLVGASLGVAFGLGELLVRLVVPQQLVIKRPDIWQAVDTLGWAHRPNVNTTINTGERTVRVITDRDGLRVGLRGRVEGKRHVLLLGDSFMEALQVEYEQSVAGLLEARLTSRLGEPVAVRNGGVGGWDPPQYLMEARRRIGRPEAGVGMLLGEVFEDRQRLPDLRVAVDKRRHLAGARNLGHPRFEILGIERDHLFVESNARDLHGNPWAQRPRRIILVADDEFGSHSPAP